VSLLAIAVGQSMLLPLVDRFREQARSHRKQKQDQKIAAFGSSYSWIALGFG